jgi:fucose permease
MKKEISIVKMLSVMFGFFVMGFVDIVGITTSYVKNDFSHLTDTMVNLISLSCFLWFLVLSIPTGMLMNRIGRKKTVLLSFAFHVLAMCLPLVAYDFTAILIVAFWNGHSTGTKYTITYAKTLEKNVLIVKY